jgi:uncharacterized NAD(P)/FAD-binding protein YdhS
VKSQPVDSTRAKKTLVIVGGGASGTICLLRCRATLPRSVDIVLVGTDPRIGRGRAYSGSNQDYLLNVPAGKMSVKLDQPDDFVNWLSTHHPEAPQGPHWPFVPRAWFGNYLEESASALGASSFKHVSDSLRSLSLRHGRWELKLKSGARLSADYLIVASGYEERIDESFLRAVDQKVSNLVIQPYNEEKLSAVRADERVLIVGSGLTAVDIFFGLRRQGVRQIEFLSRSGKFPLAHESSPNVQPGVWVPVLTGMSPLQIFRVLRALGTSRGSWIAVADQVRSQGQKIWSAWSVEERAQFIRHLKPRWETIRHRLPVLQGQELEKLHTQGSVSLHGGQIQKTECSGDGVDVTFFDWKSSAPKKLQADKIVLCSGFGLSRSFSYRPVLDGLRDCSLGLGLINDSAPRLWLAGPSAKATFWEITAIPEIVEQAHLIAAQIAADLAAGQNTNIFSAHSLQTGESYFHHFRFAFRASRGLMGQVLRLMIHGMFPFFFTDSVSNNLRYFALKLTKRRVKSAKISSLTFRQVHTNPLGNPSQKSSSHPDQLAS